MPGLSSLTMAHRGACHPISSHTSARAGRTAAAPSAVAAAMRMRACDTGRSAAVAACPFAGGGAPCSPPAAGAEPRPAAAGASAPSPTADCAVPFATGGAALWPSSAAPAPQVPLALTVA